MLLHHLVSCSVINSTGFTDTSCGAKAFDYQSAAIHSSPPPCPLVQVTDFCLPLWRECWSSGWLWASIHWPGIQPCRVNAIASPAACSWMSPCHRSGKQDAVTQAAQAALQFWLHPFSCLIPPIHPYEQCGEWGKAAGEVWSQLRSVVPLSVLPSLHGKRGSLSSPPSHSTRDLLSGFLWAHSPCFVVS